MNNGNLLNRQYLIHSLHTISAYFNASYNIIHYNCLDSVYSIFDEFDKEATILLKELIEDDDVISLDTKVDEKITLGLDPLCNKDRYTKEEVLIFEDREDKVRYAIWKIIPTFPNPLYQELKHNFKQVKTITRLFYLQMVYRLQNSNQNNYRGYSPIGLLETMQTIETNQSKKDILSIGSIWDRGVLDKKIKNDIPLAIKAEKYFFENIIKDRLNGELGWQQKSYLAIQLNSYAVKSPDDIDEMVTKSTVICKELYSLQKEYPNIIEKLEAFEWICVVDIILFVSTDEFKYYINSFLDSDSERLYIYAPLAIRTSRHFCIKLDISKRKIIFSLEENNSVLELDINIRRGFLYNLVHDKEKDIKFEKDINRIYKKHINHILLAQKSKNKTFLHKLRYDMQNLEFGAVENRLKDITRKANQLVFAHKISYYAYRGHEDILYPLVHKRDPWLRNDDRRVEEKQEEKAYKTSKRTLKEWGRDKTLREKSTLYKTLDNEEIISRFLMDGKQPIIKDSQDIVGADIKHGWFADEKDVLILPVMFHGRKQGVLYLATTHINQFLYQDRLKLTNFIQVFEAELFEARLTNFLKKINRELRKAINDENYKKNFFDYIAKKLSDLLGAVGIIIFWNHTDNNSNIDMLGVSGRDIDKIFEKKSIKKNSLLEFIDGNREDITYINHKDSNSNYAKELSDVGYGHSINLMMRDEYNNLLGILMILDKDRPNISQAFEEKAIFLLGEIQEFITHYFTAKGKVEIATLLAHDVNSIFRTIFSTKERLETYLKYIPSKEKKDYSKKLLDIDVAATYGKEMLDYITNDKAQNKSIETKPIMAYLNYFNDTQDIKNKVNIKDTIDNVLHGKDRDLKKNSIVFIFRPNELFDLSLWIHKSFLHDVLSNIIDNIVKYSKPSSRLHVNMIENPADYIIRVENIGIILNQEAQDNPNMIFEKNIRCIPDDKTSLNDGKGIGLYISKETSGFWGGDLTLEYKEIDTQWATYRFEITFPKWLGSDDNPYKRR